jgi:hypothetical protein
VYDPGLLGKERIEKVLGIDVILEVELTWEETEERCEAGVLGRPSKECPEMELFESTRGIFCSLEAPIVEPPFWADWDVLSKSETLFSTGLQCLPCI